MSVELKFGFEVAETPGSVEVRFGDSLSSNIGGHNTRHAHTAENIIVRSPIASGHNTSHTHTAPNLGKLLIELHSADASHAQTADTVPFTFRPNSTRQKHHARTHLMRLDFVYRQQSHDVIQNHVRLDFNPELPRQVHPIGHTAPDWDRWGLLETRNLAQAFYFVGLQNEQIARYGVHFVSSFVAQINLTWRAAPNDPATLPLEFDFQEGNNALPVHNAVQLHTAQQCDVGLVIPLVVQHAAQEQVADHTRVILPINAASTQHVHTADQVRVALPVRAHSARQEQTSTQPALTHTSPLANLEASHAQTAPQIRIRHEITLNNIDNTIAAHFADNTYVIHRPPARAHSTSHLHISDNIVVIHISPLVINKSVQSITSSQITIRNWVGIIPASSQHQQTAENLVLYVFAVLLAADARHLMRSTRLNFLPLDWIFRAILDIEAENRVIMIEPEDRTETVEFESRFVSIEEENRELTIPPEDRTIELDPEGRAAPVER